jgi:hypothetical protein
MFNLECLIADYKAAMKSSGAQKVIRELPREAVAEPSEVVRVLGEPKKPGLTCCTAPTT